MVVTLSVIGFTIFSGAILQTTLQQIKDKVDVVVHFVTSANEDDILNIKKGLEQLPQVSSVTYLSKEDVLAAFEQKHQNDAYLLQAIDEVGENPLGATLNIKAKDPSQYETIAQFLQNKSDAAIPGSSIIDNINYYQNKDAIDRLTKIINSADKLGFIITLFLIIISILISFNTMRLVIYMSRDEISVMRLVGASVSYIRGPFFVTGAIYGFISAILTLVLFYPLTLWLGNTTQNMLGGFNLFQYYTQNFGEIFLLLVVSGILIGAISSYLATRKYLRV